MPWQSKAYCQTLTSQSKKLIFRHFHYSEASRKKKLAYLTDCEVTKIILKQIVAHMINIIHKLNTNKE